MEHNNNNYFNEHDLYKCPKHPSKRHRTGICPFCLRDRLNKLCPDCAHARPCACPTTSSSSSFSSSSTTSASSLSFFSDAGGGCGIQVGRVGTLIESEPAFLRRSRSVKSSALSFWLRLKKKKKTMESDVHEELCYGEMRRSRSVAVEREVKARKWDFHFPSPMKVLRLSSKVLGN